jgi:hypothetical protein
MPEHDIFVFIRWRLESVQYVATGTISRVKYTEIQNIHRNEPYYIGTQAIWDSKWFVTRRRALWKFLIKNVFYISEIPLNIQREILACLLASYLSTDCQPTWRHHFHCVTFYPRHKSRMHYKLYPKYPHCMLLQIHSDTSANEDNSFRNHIP